MNSYLKISATNGVARSVKIVHDDKQWEAFSRDTKRTLKLLNYNVFLEQCSMVLRADGTAHDGSASSITYMPYAGNMEGARP